MGQYLAARREARFAAQPPRDALSRRHPTWALEEDV